MIKAQLTAKRKGCMEKLQSWIWELATSSLVGY